MLDGIPPSQDSDPEDVAWALQTADALWKRNERVDAIVWLRRAAQAAGEAQDDDRAFILARGAAELTELLAPPPVDPSTVPPRADAGVDEPLDEPSPSAPGIALIGFPPALAAAEETPVPPEGGDADFPKEEKPGEIPAPAPSAAQAHAGMLDPWANERISEPPLAGRTGRPPPPAAFHEEEVVTSAFNPAKKHSLIPLPFEAPTEPPAAPEHSDSIGPSMHRVAAMPPSSGRDEAAPISSFEVMSARSGAGVPRKAAPPPLPPRPRPRPPPLPLPSPGRSAVSPAEAPSDVISLPPEAVVEDVRLSAAPSPATGPAPGVDLTGVSALADLSASARDALALAATVSELAKDEETSGFALAYVLAGEVDVAATIVDAPVVRYAAGSLLRSRGSIDDEVSIRLIGATDRASVATWKQAALATAFRECPAVDAGLRAAANEMQALVGVSLGALGERLDKALREHVTSRLQVRGLAPGEVVVAQGQPMPGLVVLGVGEIELVTGDEVTGTIGPGEFLFASEVISSGKAPSTARAAKGGALVMSAGRAVAQELLVTCPPLLELFAGM